MHPALGRAQAGFTACGIGASLSPSAPPPFGLVLSMAGVVGLVSAAPRTPRWVVSLRLLAVGIGSGRLTPFAVILAPARRDVKHLARARPAI